MFRVLTSGAKGRGTVCVESGSRLNTWRSCILDQNQLIRSLDHFRSGFPRFLSPPYLWGSGWQRECDYNLVQRAGRVERHLVIFAHRRTGIPNVEGLIGCDPKRNGRGIRSSPTFWPSTNIVAQALLPMPLTSRTSVTIGDFVFVSETGRQ
jgi:hypothetical protein